MVAAETCAESAGTRLQPQPQPQDGRRTQNDRTVQNDRTPRSGSPAAHRLLVRLTSLTPHHISNVSVTTAKRVWTFGRGHYCDIVLPGKRVSGLHFKIFEAEGASQAAPQQQAEPIVLLEDVSQNGVYVNDRRVSRSTEAKGRQILAHGDEIALAIGRPDEEIRYVVTLPSSSRSGEEPLGGIHGKYELREQIGHGAFAVVRKAYEKSTGKPFAVKVVNRRKLVVNPKLSVHITREIEILKKVSHPNIVCYTDYFETQAALFIVMEYVAGGDLMEYILQYGPVPEDSAKVLTLEVVDAMAYLHSLGITHRDLKPDNILIETRNQQMHAKISDFGLAKVVDAGTILKTFCGTMNYLAPEVLLGGGKAAYSHGVDRWALGVVVYVTLTGLAPFGGAQHDVLSHYILNVRITYEPLVQMGISSEAIDFIKNLIVANPEERMNEPEAMRHPWLRNCRSRTTLYENTPNIADLAGPFPLAYNIEHYLIFEENQPAASALSSAPRADYISRISHARQSEPSDSDEGHLCSQHIYTPKHASPATSESRPQQPGDLNTIRGTLKRNYLQTHDSEHNNTTKVAVNSGVTRHTADTMDMDQVKNHRHRQSVPSLPHSTWCMLRTLPSSISFPDISISEPSIVIGREPGCDVVVNDPRISKRHCIVWRIQAENGVWQAMVKDTSANGLHVRSAKLKHGRTVELRDGVPLYLFKDRSASLGFQVRLFLDTSATLEDEVAATQRLHLSPVKDLDKENGNNHQIASNKRTRQQLVYARLLSLNTEYPSATVTSDDIVIGRPPEVEGPLSFTDKRISLRHCRIRRRDRSFVLTDSSLNGTWVNGKLYSSMEEVELKDKDEIVLLYKTDDSDDRHHSPPAHSNRTRIDLAGFSPVDRFGRQVQIGYIWMESID